MPRGILTLKDYKFIKSDKIFIVNKETHKKNFKAGSKFYAEGKVWEVKFVRVSPDIAIIKENLPTNHINFILYCK